MQSNRAAGAQGSAPNTSRLLQPHRIASPAQRSRKAPVASMIRCQRSGQKPAGGGIAQSAAKPSFQDSGATAALSAAGLSAATGATVSRSVKVSADTLASAAVSPPFPIGTVLTLWTLSRLPREKPSVSAAFPAGGVLPAAR